MIDQKTPNLELPLPHPDNELRDDVVRIRQSLTKIDGVAQSLFSLVASDDVNLDSVQEIVAVLKHAQGEISDITSVLATKAFSADVNAALQLKADRADVSGIIGALATKASAADVNAALSLKADGAAVLEKLAGKADSSVVIQLRSDLEQDIGELRASALDERKFRQLYDLNMESF